MKVEKTFTVKVSVETENKDEVVLLFKVMSEAIARINRIGSINLAKGEIESRARVESIKLEEE